MAAALPILEEDSPISIEGLKNILECPVCLVSPTSTPIYRCDNGHILCKDCRGKVKVCPECRIILGNLRCLTSEKIVIAMLPKVRLIYTFPMQKHISTKQLNISNRLKTYESKLHFFNLQGCLPFCQ